MDASSVQLLRAALGDDMPEREPTQDEREFWYKLIRAKIAWVIDHQFAQLPQLLYQLDVPEERVNAVFDNATRSDQIPDLLADLVLTRMEEVALARRDYDAKISRS